MRARAIAREENDDAIGFAELIGAENQRVGGIERQIQRLLY